MEGRSMGMEISIIAFAILLSLVLFVYFVGHWAKKMVVGLWHATGEWLHLHLPRGHAH